MGLATPVVELLALELLELLALELLTLRAVSHAANLTRMTLGAPHIRCFASMLAHQRADALTPSGELGAKAVIIAFRTMGKRVCASRSSILWWCTAQLRWARLETHRAVARRRTRPKSDGRRGLDFCEWLRRG